jgi:hypothetical protein
MARKTKKKKLSHPGCDYELYPKGFCSHIPVQVISIAPGYLRPRARKYKLCEFHAAGCLRAGTGTVVI